MKTPRYLPSLSESVLVINYPARAARGRVRASQASPTRPLAALRRPLPTPPPTGEGGLPPRLKGVDNFSSCPPHASPSLSIEKIPFCPGRICNPLWPKGDKHLHTSYLAFATCQAGCWVSPCGEGEALGGGRAKPLPFVRPPSGGSRYAP